VKGLTLAGGVLLLSRGLRNDRLSAGSDARPAIVASAAALTGVVAFLRGRAHSRIDANIAATRTVQHAAGAVANLDAEFHGLVAKAAHNRVLLLAKEPSSMLVRPTVELILTNNPPGIARLIEAHQNILAAIRGRDKAKALLWVERHLQDWRAGFERAGCQFDATVAPINTRRMKWNAAVPGKQ